MVRSAGIRCNSKPHFLVDGKLKYQSVAVTRLRPGWKVPARSRRRFTVLSLNYVYREWTEQHLNWQDKYSSIIYILNINMPLTLSLMIISAITTNRRLGIDLPPESDLQAQLRRGAMSFLSVYSSLSWKLYRRKKCKHSMQGWCKIVYFILAQCRN